MAEQDFTRCPGCRTIFRVTSQQLALRSGQVRCGHCHTVFNGIAALLSLAPRPHPHPGRNEPVLDEAALGPPTVTLRSAHALEPPPPSSDDPEERSEPSAGVALADAEVEDGTDPEAAYAARFSWQEKSTRRGLPAWLYAIVAPLLVVLLAGQA